MKFELESKYNVGDTLHTLQDVDVKVLKIKLNVINNNAFRFEYLVEKTNEERIWVDENNLRR